MSQLIVQKRNLSEAITKIIKASQPKPEDLIGAAGALGLVAQSATGHSCQVRMVFGDEIFDLAVVEKAMRKAFEFGQIHWSQADSDSHKQNAKAGETFDKFEQLIKTTLEHLK